MTNGLEQAARHLAATGAAEIERVAAITRRAREMLVDSVFAPTGATEPKPYAWQAEEDFPVGAPLQIYLASIDDFATGEGLSIYFMVGHAPSENAFRGDIAGRVGPHFADRAVIAQGSDAQVPFGALFLSSALKAKLERMERDEDQPGAFSFFAKMHGNYS